jgi:hypothetical protein
MASFKYIGLQTKENGTIDVKVPKLNKTWQTFTGVIPNTTVIDVTDAKSIAALEYAVDQNGLFIYERTA